MSLGEELALDSMIDELLYPDIYCDILYDNLYEGIWTTRDGTEKDIKTMTTAHINNCIKMLSHNDSELAIMWIDKFRNELKRRENVLNDKYKNR